MYCCNIRCTGSKDMLQSSGFGGLSTAGMIAVKSGMTPLETLFDQFDRPTHPRRPSGRLCGRVGVQKPNNLVNCTPFPGSMVW